MIACSTGWRRLIESPNLHVIFHKRATEYKSLLQKMTYKDKGSHESWPPCSTPLATTCCNVLGWCTKESSYTLPKFGQGSSKCADAQSYSAQNSEFSQRGRCENIYILIYIEYTYSHTYIYIY